MYHKTEHIYSLNKDGFHKIVFRLYSKSSNLKKRCILCLHPIFFNKNLFNIIAPKLIKYATVVTPDYIGHGDSDCLYDSKKYTYSGIALDFCALLNYVHAEETVIIGSSMGGLSALMLATKLHNIKGIIMGDIGHEISKQLVLSIESTHSRYKYAQRILHYFPSFATFLSNNCFGAEVKNDYYKIYKRLFSWIFTKRKGVLSLTHDLHYLTAFKEEILSYEEFTSNKEAVIDLSMYMSKFKNPILLLASESQKYLPHVLVLKMLQYSNVEFSRVPNSTHPLFFHSNTEYRLINRWLQNIWT